jgi:hypothetical protein
LPSRENAGVVKVKIAMNRASACGEANDW